MVTLQPTETSSKVPEATEFTKAALLHWFDALVPGSAPDHLDPTRPRLLAQANQ